MAPHGHDQLVPGAGQPEVLPAGQRQRQREHEPVAVCLHVEQVGYGAGVGGRVRVAVQLSPELHERRDADRLARAIGRQQHRQAAGVGAYGLELGGLRHDPAAQERFVGVREHPVGHQPVDAVAVQRE